MPQSKWPLQAVYCAVGCDDGDVGGDGGDGGGGDGDGGDGGDGGGGDVVMCW